MPRRERDQEILGIELAARAEAAADVVLDQVDRVSAAARACAAKVRRLKNGTLAAPSTVIRRLRRVPFGEHAARLHRQCRVALRLEALAADVRRVAECRVGIALARR